MQDLRVIVEAAGTEDGMESGTWAGFGVGSGSGVKTGAIPWAGTKSNPNQEYYKEIHHKIESKEEEEGKLG